MSFEGHYQFLCENGHKGGSDAYDYYMDDPFDSWKCHCGAGLAWWNLVDVTNGSFCDCAAGRNILDINGDFSELEGCEYCEHGRIDGWIELEVDQPAVTETCQCCGHTKVVSQPTYKIPKDRGHRNGE